MAAITSTFGRVGSVRQINRDKRPLAAGASVKRGGLAVALLGGSNKGYYKQGASGEVSVAVGRFRETVDNTAGGNGAASAEIEFFKQRNVFLLLNDTGTAILIGDRESAAFTLDDQTVTKASAGNSICGVIYDVTSEGVWVEVGASPPQEQSLIPNIQSGTSTLVAGTKTVTGVTLTAGSEIIVTMRDPGAGAITGLGALDVPVATRNTSTGQFVVNAIDDSKALITTAVCTFDYVIVG